MSREEESRVEESRRRVQQRLAQVGDAAEREKRRALVIKDAAIALLGTVGALLALRRVGKSVRGGKKKKQQRGGPRSAS